MRNVLFTLSIACNIFAIIVFLGSYLASEMNAVQGTQAAAFCLALAVIPYCLARSWQELGRKD